MGARERDNVFVDVCMHVIYLHVHFFIIFEISFYRYKFYSCVYVCVCLCVCHIERDCVVSNSHRHDMFLTQARWQRHELLSEDEQPEF